MSFIDRVNSKFLKSKYTLSQDSSRLSRSWKQVNTEKLSQNRKDWGDMSTKCHEVSQWGP